MNEKDEIFSKLKEYETFVDSVLRPQLVQAQKSLHETQQEIKDYQELLDQLQTFLSSQSKIDFLKSTELQVDLGHQKLYCGAQLDTNEKNNNDNHHQQEPTIFIHVGMGFHVEFSLVEGGDFVTKRISFLENISQTKELKVQKIEEHLQSSGFILDELSKELGRIS